MVKLEPVRALVAKSHSLLLSRHYLHLLSCLVCKSGSPCETGRKRVRDLNESSALIVTLSYDLPLSSGATVVDLTSDDE